MFLDIGRLMRATGNFTWGQEEPDEPYTWPRPKRTVPVEPEHTSAPPVELETADAGHMDIVSGTSRVADNRPPVVPVPPNPVDVLVNALEAAETDTDRSALLNAAGQEVRERLNARLRYLKIMRSENPHAMFERELAAAVDDAARRVVIASRSAEFLDNWAWWQRSDHTSRVQRYLNIVSAR
jgi:hypothetical protein